MAELSPAEKWIQEAKRRVAERKGETYDPDADAATEAPVTEAPAVTPPQEEPVTAAVPAEDPDAEASAAPAAPIEPAPTADTTPISSPATAAPTNQPTPAPKPAPAAPTSSDAATYPYTNVRKLSRREFLAYSWAAAVGIVATQQLVSTGLLMYPRFKAGEFGGDFFLGLASALPDQSSAPQGDPIGKFWLVNTEQGPRALYMVCTHLGCLYKWVEANRRFECPCHGSKFTREGVYIEGPAPRSLDQFVIEIQEGGSVVASTEATADGIQPPGVPSSSAEIVVKTGQRIQGSAIS